MMKTFRSYDLIVSRNIADDCRHVCDLIDTDFSHWEIFLLYFGMDANIFLAIMFIWGTFNISTANDSNFTV